MWPLPIEIGPIHHDQSKLHFFRLSCFQQTTNYKTQQWIDLIQLSFSINYEKLRDSTLKIIIYFYRFQSVA